MSAAIRAQLDRGAAWIAGANRRAWALRITFGPGAGYRWIDLPGHSQNIADGWRCRWLSIPGFTLVIGRNLYRYERGSVRHYRRVWIGLYVNGNSAPFTPEGVLP